MKHSSYTYQKLFRALYGYTQIVDKANGKTYKYHRPGVLSSMPFFRSGKNCVVIPLETLQTLIKFFKTGMNPTHKWRVKGDWKAVYYMDEKQISPKMIIDSVEQLIDRQYLNNKKPLFEELKRVSESENTEQEYVLSLSSFVEPIIKHLWFKTACDSSKKLKEFKELFEKLPKLKT